MSDDASPKKHPRVGVGIILRRASDGAVLVGERRGSHGAGQLALPGGALEWTESLRACASRECIEETGVDVPESAWTVPYAICESVIDANNHWVTVFALAHVDDVVDVINVEPHKCAGWTWKSATALRSMEKDVMFKPLWLLVHDAERGDIEGCVPTESSEVVRG